MFDILYSAIHLFNGLQKPELPGMLVMTPPRGAARGRETDILFGYFYSANAVAEPVEKQQDWLKKIAESFYKSPGTVTSGMRLVIEKINTDLLTRNLDRSREGSRLSGSLSLAVLHHGMLFYTNIGSIRSFVITKTETTDSGENELSIRGLGISQGISPKFQQVEIHANDLVIFSPAPPLSWTAASLAGSADLSVEALRRRLSNVAGLELKAALFRFVEGNGKALPLAMRFAQGEPSTVETSAQVPTKPAVIPAPTTAKQTDVPVIQNSPQAIPQATTIMTIREEEGTLPAESRQQVAPQEPVKEDPFLSADSQPVKPATNRQESVSPKAAQRSLMHEQKAEEKPALQKQNTGPSQTSRAVAGSIGWFNRAFSTVKTWFARLLQSMLPGLHESTLKLSTPTMLLISIAVPLLVGAIGISFFVRVGQTQQFDSYLVKAEQYATQAAGQQADAASQLASWQQAMYWLDLAGKYGSSDNYLALKTQAQAGLDALNGIQRLAFSPALATSLDPGAKISQMVATQTDLYLLDSTTGKVLRYFYAGSIFQKDDVFDCGPNQSPLGTSIGNVVDILALPAGNQFGATVLAIDSVGGIEYCIPGETGMVNALNAPDSGWGKIQSIAFSQNTLFVLDSGMNAVYRYEGNGVEFPDKPVLFFDSQIPPLGKAIDIEINADELYILRSSGDLVECTYSFLKGYKPTECQDPAPYGDMRTGQTPQAVSFPEADFIQMHMTDAPDSSLYMMDAKGKTIYHFSLQRNLQKVYLPSFANDNSLAKLVTTSFAVSPGRLIFVAFQNDVQFTQLP